ncbi:hypothetical protein [Baekduia soli]|uniref:hypothetical protein n=1 Tax=Baekduia soli TaxID=496014 RepID=UPI001E334BE6|nr:hypothetical protein [Baekduia soli]
MVTTVHVGEQIRERVWNGELIGEVIPQVMMGVDDGQVRLERLLTMTNLMCVHGHSSPPRASLYEPPAWRERGIVEPRAAQPVGMRDVPVGQRGDRRRRRCGRRRGRPRQAGLVLAVSVLVASVWRPAAP